MSEWAAALIEISGPLGLLGAQLVYLGEPFLRLVVSSDHTRALARVLEDPEEARKFAAYLREGQVS